MSIYSCSRSKCFSALFISPSKIARELFHSQAPEYTYTILKYRWSTFYPAMNHELKLKLLSAGIRGSKPLLDACNDFRSNQLAAALR